MKAHQRNESHEFQPNTSYYTEIQTLEEEASPDQENSNKNNH